MQDFLEIPFKGIPEPIYKFYCSVWGGKKCCK